MEKDTSRYTSTRIDIGSLLNKENKKLDLDHLLEPPASPARETIRQRKKEVRHISPGEYIVIISMVITSLYLLVTSFFPLVYNVVTSFEPINFLMNLFYFILGIGVIVFGDFVSWLNSFSNGHAIGALGVVVTFLGLLGESYQVITIFLR